MVAMRTEFAFRVIQFRRAEPDHDRIDCREDVAAVPASVEVFPSQTAGQPSQSFAHDAVLAAVIGTGESPGLGVTE
jgi:hypothetical protein